MVDMLHQYQLEIPETLDEFWNVCDVLKQNGILPYGANKDFGPVSYTHIDVYKRQRKYWSVFSEKAIMSGI